jgi:DNA-directed RNA polymerase subunit L
VGGELRFRIGGDDDYGLDKSLVNALRRILLTDIPRVAFNLTTTDENNDLTICANNSSIHNEMLSHRIALMPLYIDPENYMNHHLFECKVTHESIEPFKFITMNDVNIYPLKPGFQERIDHYYDESYDMSEEDEHIIIEQLQKVDIENYALDKPFSQVEKDKIFRPFEFRGGIHYPLITELKATRTEDVHQDIHFFGSPSVGYGHQDAKFQCVSQSTYSFEINDSLVQSVLKERLETESIPSDDKASYEKNFLIAESERYFHRDNDGEPNRYNFAIKSCCYYDSETLFMKSLEILTGNLHDLKLELINMLKEEKSRVSFTQNSEFVYHYVVEGESHTLGNLIQSHIMRRCVGHGYVNLFGYKKPHPLEDKILFIASIDKSHKLAKSDEVTKSQSVTTFIIDSIDEIVQDVKILIKVSSKKF